MDLDPQLGGSVSPTFDQNFLGETSQENNMEKEKYIQELRMEIVTSSDLIKDLRSEIDDLCQGLEKSQRTRLHEFQTVFVIFQKENMSKDLISNAKEELTAERDTLCRRTTLMEEVKCVSWSSVASIRDPSSIEREVIQDL
jgi:hypothetical protein